MGLFSSIKHDILAFIARCNGNGVIAEDFEARELDIEEVNSLSIAGPWCVEIRPATGKNHGRIILERRFLDRADFRYGAGELNLSLLEVIGFGPKVKPRMELYLNKLPGLILLQETAKILTDELIAGEEIHLELRGEAQGDFRQLQAETIKVHLHLRSEFCCQGEIKSAVVKSYHHSKCEFSGTLSTLEADMANASCLTVESCQRAVLRLSEGAEARLRVTESLNVTGKGMSKVVYSGNPAVEKNILEYAEVRQQK